MNRPTILIVDDEATNIELLVKLLNGKYELKVAYDGVVALEIAKKFLPDLILLDIQMPKMDGFEVAYSLKNDKNTKDIPIIFITVKESKDVIINAFQAGASDYIIKPFFKEELRLRIANQIKIKLLQEELSSVNRIQEQLLIQQSKFASMGEMIAAIAHQWRQPLATLGAVLINLEDSFENSELDKKALTKFLDQADNNISYMTNTIDDFRNFFIPSKTKEIFCLKKATLNALRIIDATFHEHFIEIEFLIEHEKTESYQDSVSHKEKEFLVNGYANEFSQVIINLLNNAKDAIDEKLQEHDTIFKNPIVKIDIFKEENEIIIHIEDNAGGIPANVLNRIFEPYFTTKEEGKGTGIGLYMSKTIIENNMQGKLNAYNNSQGAIFEIRMKIDD